jgi:DNA segregation ATPase FtsK/SpoIIIE-like protein
METIIFFAIAGLLLFIAIRINDIHNLLVKERENSIFYNEKEARSNDEDYNSAKDFVISTGKASTSSLQTAFRWGYNKSARVIADLEEDGVVEPAQQGERYRKVNKEV